MPARLAIFVAQLGRKFRLISLTMQRYESFIAVYEFSGENFKFLFSAHMSAASLPSGRFRGGCVSWARCCALQRCSSRKGFPTSYIYSYISIYIYIYRYIDLKFDLQTIRFRTATPQRRNSESRAKLAWAMPSTSGVDEVSKCDTSRQTPFQRKISELFGRIKRIPYFCSMKQKC